MPRWRVSWPGFLGGRRQFSPPGRVPQDLPVPGVDAPPATSPVAGPEASRTSASNAVAPSTSDSDALATGRGTTTVSDRVIAKTAGQAARAVPGVHGFGGSAARAFSSNTTRTSAGRASVPHGVSVEVGDRRAAVDLTIVVEYGVAIPDVARSVRHDVIAAVEQVTSLEVAEVDIDVVDLKVDGSGLDTGDGNPASRRVH